MQQKKRTTYHHGDAKNALLSAAAQLLEEVGAQRLSLRAIAGQAGLSHQAPYNHFANKEALLAELVRKGFNELKTAIQAVEGYPNDKKALKRAGAAYIEFAQAAPALFHLMFSRTYVDTSYFPETAQAADSSFQSLVNIIAAFAPAERVEELALAAWCLVHGYATLSIELGFEEKQNNLQRAELFAALIKQNALQCKSNTEH